MFATVTEKFWTPLDKEVDWASSAASICVTTAGGAISGGPLGAIVGLCSSIADEYLIHQEIQEKHNLSTTLFWSYVTVNPFCTTYLPTMPAQFYEATSLVSGTALSYFTDDFLDFRERLSLPFSAFSMINRFFDEKNIFSKQEVYELCSSLRNDPKVGLSRLRADLYELSHNPLITGSLKVLAMATLQVFASSGLLYLLGSYGNSLFINALMQSYSAKGDATIKSPLDLPYDLQMTGLSMLGLLLIKHLLDVVYNSATTHIAIDIFEKGISKSSDKLMDGDNGRKLLAHEKGKEISSYLSQDVSTLLNAFFKIEDTFKRTADALVSLGVLSTMAPGLVTPYLFTLFPAQYFYRQMSQRVKKISTELMTNKMRYWRIMSLMNNCLEPIKLRDADEYFKHYYRVYGKKDTYLTQGKEVSGIVTRSIERIMPIFQGTFDMFFIGYHVLIGSFTLTQLPFLKDALNKVFSFFSGNLMFQLSNTDLLLSKSRLEQFFDLVDAPYEQKTVRTTNTENQIQIKDYQLLLDNEPILGIDKLNFELGKTYAITGPSGCGKSTFLIDLKLGVFGNLSSEGEISLPMQGEAPSKTMFLDQELFLPPETPLFECILFPKIIEQLPEHEVQETRERVLALFEELEIDQFDQDDEGINLASRLDSKEFKLSGGQRKKIGFIQAILSKPDILILDETFAGLDNTSRIKCQSALKKYLPDVLTLVVDHHAHQNNDQGYYDSHIHFSDGKIEEKSI